MHAPQLFCDIGDPSAYALVRDHFAMMAQVLQQHRGALVKTVGDAVMAVFLSARDGVDTALAIQSGNATLNANQLGRPPLRIKLGLHRCSCIAITANNVLDYFGSTVNLAARVHTQSHGDDIIVTEAMMDDPEVRLRVQEAGLNPERFEAALAGFAGVIALYRLDVHHFQAANADKA